MSDFHDQNEPMPALPPENLRATPTMIAAAWRAFRQHRPGVRLEPGPAFVEAVNAALAVDDRVGDRSGAGAQAGAAPALDLRMALEQLEGELDRRAGHARSGTLDLTTDEIRAVVALMRQQVARPPGEHGPAPEEDGR